MPKEPPKIPVIGWTGLQMLFGCLVGVVADRLLEKTAVETFDPLATPIFEGFHVDDLIGLALPLGLMMVTKKFRFFWLGWFIGQLATELYEVLHGMGGYTARM